MKKWFSLTGMLLLLMITGCGTVVYRVNPDTLSPISVSEALDAVELSMYERKPNLDVSSFVVNEDEMLIHRTPFAGLGYPAALVDFNKVYYGEIDLEVRKMEESFTVGLRMRNVSSSERILLAWKSKEDAIQFANAAYILANKDDLRRRFARTSAPPWVKRAPTPPAQEAVKEVQKKPTKVKPQAKALELNKPPRITIDSPDITRAVSVVAKQTTLIVTGIAESNVGIMDIVVNRQQADYDEKGRFSKEMPLRVGQNEITVTAIDIYGNEATKQFTVSRESGNISNAAKPEAVAPVKGIRSAKYYALLIAVQDYASRDINRLDYPITDANRLMEALVSNYTFEPENVVLLYNPNRRSIYRALHNMRSRLTEQDNLLVFYAGHGIWVDDMKQGFWLPQDASGPNDPSDWIPNSNVRDYFKSIRAKHILLVSDACFSGGIFKVRTAFTDSRPSIEKIYEMSSRKAITSGSLKIVPDQSVFVEFLIKRLVDNAEPYLDAQKLYTSFREAVINNSATGQTPLYGAINEAGDEGGDFVFVRRR